MIGSTLAEKARTREFVALADEATTMFSFWVRKASPLFTGRDELNRDAARLGAEWYYRRLREIDMLMSEKEGEFLVGNSPTIADCITYSTVPYRIVLEFGSVASGRMRLSVHAARSIC